VVPTEHSLKVEAPAVAVDVLWHTSR